LRHHAVRAHPPQDLHRQSFQQIGLSRSVVSGVENDQDVPVARAPAAHADEVLDYPADLRGSGLGDVVGRTQAHGVQDLAPGRPARLQRAAALCALAGGAVLSDAELSTLVPARLLSNDTLLVLVDQPMPLRDIVTGLAEAELPGHTKQLLTLLPDRSMAGATR
jgi:hypothetical protein